MKKKTGITILAILFAFLTIAGFGNGFFFLAELNNYVLGAGALTYGLLALITSIGLWRSRPWTHSIYILWCVSVIFLSFSMQFSLVGNPLWKFTLSLLVLGVVLLIIERYIYKSLKATL